MIKETREKLGLSAAELAKKAGCSRQYIYEIEEGKRVPTTFRASAFKRICRSLGLNYTAIILSNRYKYHKKMLQKAEQDMRTLEKNLSMNQEIIGDGCRFPTRNEEK